LINVTSSPAWEISISILLLDTKVSERHHSSVLLSPHMPRACLGVCRFPAPRRSLRRNRSQSGGEKERLSGWTVAPGKEQIPDRLLQNVFGAVWPSGNAASHGQGNEPMDQAPTSFHQISDICSLDALGLGPLLECLTC
jgi:hypothetical protein